MNDLNNPQASQNNDDQTSFNPPVFHNPLAQAHDDHIAQLPPLQSAESPPSPNTESQPPSASINQADLTSGPIIPEQPALAVSDQANSQVVNQAAMPASPLPIHQNPLLEESDIALQPSAGIADVATQTEVAYEEPKYTEEVSSSSESQIAPPESATTNSYITPAPVRLAPEPQSPPLNLHSAPEPQSHTSVNQGGALSPAEVTERYIAAEKAANARRKRLFLILGLIALGVTIIVTVVGLLMGSNRGNTPTPTKTVPLNSKRDTTEKALLSGAERVSSDCFVFQAPKPIEISQNKDCQVDMKYGEQKLSSVTVSTFREFDLVQSDEEATNPSANRFDSTKITEAFIKKVTEGKTIVSRETIDLAKLPAEKLVVKGGANASSEVAYVFVVLPEGDRKFSERTFIAFAITGAYSDDFSRKSFDQSLKTWSWKK